ncbi:hypothetical protein TRVA0_007S00474 [Trichomonascus vanleenenianus]|uniref:uncharacterized protein n=1 Tax=Trichomonascus vanleenenianus TaxID=2268995 RepID=UPI003EC9D75B
MSIDRRQADVTERRNELDRRFLGELERICEKYGAQEMLEMGDVVDMASGEIIEDRGHLRGLEEAGRSDIWSLVEESRKKRRKPTGKAWSVVDQTPTRGPLLEEDAFDNLLTPPPPQRKFLFGEKSHTPKTSGYLDGYSGLDWAYKDFSEHEDEHEGLGEDEESDEHEKLGEHEESDGLDNRNGLYDYEGPDEQGPHEDEISLDQDDSDEEGLIEQDVPHEDEGSIDLHEQYDDVHQDGSEDEGSVDQDESEDEGSVDQDESEDEGLIDQNMSEEGSDHQRSETEVEDIRYNATSTYHLDLTATSDSELSELNEDEDEVSSSTSSAHIPSNPVSPIPEITKNDQDNESRYERMEREITNSAMALCGTRGFRCLQPQCRKCRVV